MLWVLTTYVFMETKKNFNTFGLKKASYQELWKIFKRKKPSYQPLKFWAYIFVITQVGKKVSLLALQENIMFPKMLSLKWICYCKKSLIDRMICKKDFVLFLFPHRTYVLDIC